MTPESLFQTFQKNDLTFFSGVPDSTFKGWMSFLAAEHGRRLTQVIACNECEAVAVAAGYHLATRKIGTVYMQNSGEGKTVNPLTSLCDREVYAIPMILMIGWRGEPGKKDEPQHKKMGRITVPLLEVLEIPHVHLPRDDDEAAAAVAQVKRIAESQRTPAALIIREGTIEEFAAAKGGATGGQMSREEALQAIVDTLAEPDIVVATTGKTSRELFEYRVAKGQPPRDFYTVGSMGCAASIAHAIALAKPDRSVYAFDGDGALLMQMGALATIGYCRPANLRHIVFDNGAYDSTGGQPSTSSAVDFTAVARACGYPNAFTVRTASELRNVSAQIRHIPGPVMVVVKVRPGSRSNLGRPTTTPIENKERFMEFVRS